MPTAINVINNIKDKLSYRVKEVWAEKRRSFIRGESMFIYIETSDLSLTPYEVIEASGVPLVKAFVNIETPRKE